MNERTPGSTPSAVWPSAADSLEQERFGAWEDEGGRAAAGREIEQPKNGDVPAEMRWYEFLAARFPGRRRHDMEALKAYESYRATKRG